MHDANSQMIPSSGLDAVASSSHDARLRHLWHFECYDKDGNLKWTDGFENLVTTVGKNDYLDKTIKGSSYTASWYVGLKNTGTEVVGDTMASHGSWTENVTYSNANRPGYTAGTVSGGSVDNSASKAVFNINGTTTIYGAFMVGNHANAANKSGTDGTLLCVGDFSASRAVVNGDTLNVQVTLTIS